jgi:hypothetical protein
MEGEERKVRRNKEERKRKEKLGKTKERIREG